MKIVKSPFQSFQLKNLSSVLDLDTLFGSEMANVNNLVFTILMFV